MALVGPTASGKTAASVALARTLDAEIVSVDSMLIYRGMDVGTAKPSAAERASVPHHLIDLVEPREPFSVALFQSRGRSVIRGVRARGHRPLLVGGSGLYFRALVDDLEFPGTDAGMRGELERQASVLGPARLYLRLVELDPVGAAKIEPGNVRRIVRALEVAGLTGRPFSDFSEAWGRYPPGRVLAAGVEIPRAILDARAAGRVHAMLDAGWLGEVRRLLDEGFGGWLTSSQAIGYAELALHLAGQMTLEQAVERTVKRTKNLARRQMAWFKRDPRIRWFPVGEGGALGALDEIRSFLEDGA
jgi:tRNA dimethylallyltransferase